MSERFHATMQDAGGRTIEIDEASTSELQLWVGIINDQGRMLLTEDNVDELMDILKCWRKMLRPIPFVT